MGFRRQGSAQEQEENLTSEETVAEKPKKSKSKKE